MSLSGAALLKLVQWACLRALKSAGTKGELTAEVLAQLKTELPSLDVNTLAGSPLPWNHGLAVLAAAHAPLSLERDECPLAEPLRTALVHVVNTTGSALRLLPSPEHLFLQPDLAQLDLAAFLFDVLDAQGINATPYIAALLTAAANVHAQMLEGASAPERALLSGVSTLLSALGVATKSQRSQLEPRVYQIFENALELAPNRPDMVVRYSLVESEAPISVESKPTRQVQEAWLSAAERQRTTFSARQGRRPPIAEVYVTPTIRNLDDSSTAELQVAFDTWLAAGADVPVVLVGTPGGGKTTTVRWLLDRTLKRYLASGTEKDYFPLLVQLKDLRSRRAIFDEPDLVKRAEVAFQSFVQSATALEDLETRNVPNQHMLLLLDGFDELGLASEEQVTAFLDTLTVLSRQQSLAIILTGRTLALHPYWPHLHQQRVVGRTWRRLELLPFTLGRDGSCHEFCLHWLVALGRSENAIPASLLELIHGVTPFSDLVTTPVLLALLCELYSDTENVIAPSSALRGLRAIAWLVEEAIKKRANPLGRDSISEEAYRARVRRYAGWAWQAVLGGGTEFTAAAVDSNFTGMDWLVEFFFEPSQIQAGHAVFVHRSIAEFLATKDLAMRFADVAKNATNGANFLLHTAQELAKRDLLFDANIHALLAYHLRLETAPADLATAAREAIRALCFRPWSLDWKEVEVDTHLVFAVSAELLLTLLLALDPTGLSSYEFRNLVMLRSRSARLHLPWSNTELPQNVENISLADAGLAGIMSEGGRFQAVGFSGADLHGARLNNTIFIACNFSNANLSGADFTGAIFHDCSFTNVRLNGTNLDGAFFFKGAPNAVWLAGVASARDADLPLATDTARGLTTLSETASARIWWRQTEKFRYRWLGGVFIVPDIVARTGDEEIHIIITRDKMGEHNVTVAIRRPDGELKAGGRWTNDQFLLDRRTIEWVPRTKDRKDPAPEFTDVHVLAVRDAVLSNECSQPPPRDYLQQLA